MAKNQIVGALVIAASIAALVATGIVGIGRGDGQRQADFGFYYSAGRAWIAGENPYDPAVYRKACSRYAGISVNGGVAYPPHFAPLAMLFGALDLEMARSAFLVLNLTLIGSLALVSVKMVVHAERRRLASDSPTTWWLLPALVIGNPFTQHLLWLGQLAIWASALLAWAWHLSMRRRELLAGVLLALATMKPNLAALPVLWLLLERRWSTLGSAAVVAVLLSLPVWLDVGPVEATRQWMAGVAAYQGGSSGSVWGANDFGHHHVVGLPSALVSIGVPMPGPGVLLGIVAILTLGLWCARRRVLADDVLGILLCLELGLVYAHDSELFYLAPVAAAVWLHVAHRPGARLAAALCATILFIPQRVLRDSGVRILDHWRTAIVLIALGSLIWMGWRETRSSMTLPDADVRP